MNYCCRTLDPKLDYISNHGPARLRFAQVRELGQLGDLTIHSTPRLAADIPARQGISIMLVGALTATDPPTVRPGTVTLDVPARHRKAVEAILAAVATIECIPGCDEQRCLLTIRTDDPTGSPARSSWRWESSLRWLSWPVAAKGKAGA